MQQSLAIAQAVFQNLRKPSQQKLPWQTLLRAMSDCQKRLLREAQLSDRGWMETSFGPFTPASLDDPLAIDNFSVPTRVEYRVTPDTDAWYPVPIVNHDIMADVSGDVVSFYGSPVHIHYSGLNINELVGREYRIWYEVSPSVLTDLSQEIEVFDIFTDLLTDETTVYCIPLVDDDSETWQKWIRLQIATTSDRLAESKKQFRRWLNMARDNGIVFADGFQPVDCYSEAAYLGPDGYPRAS